MPTDGEMECTLISAAGSASSSALLAIDAAKGGDFDKAQELLAKSGEDLKEAHEIEKQIIVKEARGEAVPTGVLMMHAQDHLNAAMINAKLASEFINLFARLSKLEKESL